MLSSRFSKNLIMENSTSLKKYFSNGNEVSGRSLTIVRKPAPDFKGMSWWNNEFKPVSLDSFNGKWVCLFFYPLDFTFVCPTEIVDYNDKSTEFAQASKHFFYKHIYPPLPKIILKMILIYFYLFRLSSYWMFS
jgi:hypothetical protein